MEKPKEDRRVRRTKKLLKQGLSELMKERDFKDISVKDITERMDLNRGTFYLHYTDIYDLLEKIEDDVLNDFQHMIDVHKASATSKSVMPVIEPLVEYINENFDICGTLLLNNAANDFLIKIKNLIILNVKALLERNFEVKAPPEVLNYTLNYMAYGIIGIFKEWMSDFTSIGKKEIINLSDKIIYATVQPLI